MVGSEPDLQKGWKGVGIVEVRSLIWRLLHRPGERLGTPDPGPWALGGEGSGRWKRH